MLFDEDPEDKPKFHELFDYEYIIELTLIFWALLAAVTITLYLSA